MPRTTRAIVAFSIAGGALTLFLAARQQPAPAPVSHSQWVIAVVLGLLTLASWLWPVVIYRGGESEAFNLDEGFFVILALLVPPLVTLATLALATVLAQAARRRPAVKSAFNAGQVLIAAGLGLAVSRAIAVPSHPLTAGPVAAMAAGAGAYFVVNTILVAAVVVSMGASWRDFTTDLPLQVTFTGTGALVGVLMALAIEVRLWALALAVPGLVLERWLISARFSALHDRARMEGLYEVTLEANRCLRQQAVLDTILGAARRLLRSPAATLAPDDPGPGQLAAPMIVASRTQWLVASGRRRDEPVDEGDQSLLRALAAVGSGALSNAELYQQVHIERERLSAITLSIGEGVCAIDAAGKLTFVNRAAADMMELDPVSVGAGEPAGEAACPAPDFLLAAARQAMSTEATIRAEDAWARGRSGSAVPVAYTASAVMSDGRPSGAVITFRDITERKAFEDQLHRHAFYDSLTGLANRRLLVDQLEQALRRSVLDGQVHALIFVDVDRFKSINDSLGHVTGDELLVAIATRMKNAVRSHDLAARFGGDEFVVLLLDVPGIDVAIAAAERICAAVEEPMVLADGYELVASVSAGIALTEPGKTADDVLRNADVAMYDAKVRGGGSSYRVFDQTAMGSRSSERLQIEAELRKALERHELEVHYQPFYSLSEQRIVGAEALVRWRHPVHGLISPVRFIPVAEETGLILPLGKFVLNQACRQVRSMRERLHADLPVSVNLSPRQFQESSLLAQVTSVLDDNGLPPDLLMFEITESMVMEDLAGAHEIMKKLNRLGTGLAIDDFGTGHSSLAYLKQFPVQEVKVDRAFIKSVAESAVDSAIVRAIIDLASALGMAVVAEGVETEDQATELSMLGCHVAQGFYFSRPLSAPDFEIMVGADLLRRGQGPAAGAAPAGPAPDPVPH
jgi:diguanylate cyclase (GGDEF)-like protein/PAS domain S-box-containing protein